MMARQVSGETTLQGRAAVDTQALATLARALKAALGPGAVHSAPDALVAFAYDGGFLDARPDLVALPADAEQVALAVRLATAAGVPIVPRGSGTGLCGGAVAVRGGVVIATTRMNRVLSIDARNRRAMVEPGVINLDLSRA